ncbi:hypothetical protein ACFCYN_24085 [Gottfriedia sp. NPDC056225]|uniref:hypothetical protein n=1 Tax=Gottfriedia sp. NPDC056225 TaxID=3345751 RepID=UPI0035DE5AEE
MKARPKEMLPVQRLTKSLLSNSSDKATVTWFGHSTSILQVDGQFLLLDPVFEKYSSPFK